MKLGEILKQKRVDLNLTQEEVGDKLYVTRQTISNWENCRTLPDIDSLIDIANFYELSLDNILLKGSDVVKDIQRKEKIVRLYKWSVIPYLTFFLLIFLMYRSMKDNNITNLLLVSLLIFLNSGYFFFFESQMREVKGLEIMKISKKGLLVLGGFILVGFVIGFLLSYFNVFNT